MLTDMAKYSNWNKPLPDDPTELLNAALEDLAKCEDDPTYSVDMLRWHVPAQNNTRTCYVCLAGAVMAKTFDLPPDSLATPGCFDPKTHFKLKFLDMIREGTVYFRPYFREKLVLPHPHGTRVHITHHSRYACKDDHELFAKSVRASLQKFLTQVKPNAVDARSAWRGT
jgi:hypothetical protein